MHKVFMLPFFSKFCVLMGFWTLQVFPVWSKWNACWISNCFLCVYRLWYSCQYSWRGKEGPMCQNLCTSATRDIHFLPLLTLAGKKSAERSTIGNRGSVGYLLCIIYGRFHCYCWASTIFRYGPRYSYFISLCKTWNAMGHVSPDYLLTPLCMTVL